MNYRATWYLFEQVKALRADNERLTQQVQSLLELRETDIRIQQGQAVQIERLRAERDGLRKLLDDNSYIRCKADYERGHLSHCNYLDATERKALGAVLKETKP
jgi:hypothetical protein